MRPPSARDTCGIRERKCDRKIRVICFEKNSRLSFRPSGKISFDENERKSWKRTIYSRLPLANIVQSDTPRNVTKRDEISPRSSTYHFAGGESRGGRTLSDRRCRERLAAGSGHAEWGTVAPRRRRVAGCGTTASPRRMQTRAAHPHSRRVLVRLVLESSLRRSSSSSSSPSSVPLADLHPRCYIYILRHSSRARLQNARRARETRLRNASAECIGISHPGVAKRSNEKGKIYKSALCRITPRFYCPALPK